MCTPVVFLAQMSSIRAASELRFVSWRTAQERRSSNSRSALPDRGGRRFKEQVHLIDPFRFFVYSQLGNRVLPPTAPVAGDRETTARRSR